MPDDLPMPHQNGARGNRRKTRQEILRMISEYELQIQAVENKGVQRLLFAEIRRLRDLLGNKEE